MSTFCTQDRGYVRKARRTTRTYSRLHSASKQWGRAAQINLVKGIRTFKSNISTEELKKAWESRSYGNILSVIPWSKLRTEFEPFQDTLQSSLETSAQWSIRALPKPTQSSLRYDVKNPKIKRWISEKTGERIVNIEEDAKQVVQRIVTQSFTKAYTPRQVALHIKESIGLDPRREKALENYADSFLYKGYTDDQILKFSAKYADRLLNDRCLCIGRTETRRATNHGQLTVWKQAKDEGLLPEGSQKVWIVDGNPCPICDPMDGVTADIDGFWTIGETGEVVDNPTDAHPNCYCGMELEFGES